MVRRGAARAAWLATICLAFMAPVPAPAAADDFYEVAVADLDGPPGSLIRRSGMDVPLTGAAVYRILYRSTGLGGEPIAVSGMAVVPYGKAPPGGWPVIAWAHPTTGIARGCAPTLLLARPTAIIPGINQMLARGYVVAATDYPGLGTGRPHPYLVGVSEGRALLDSVRAVREMTGAAAGERFVAWGHSQGGHAALFAGQIAAGYAPELTLLGVAAAAPATELGRLFVDDRSRLSGRVIGAMVIDSWADDEVYGAPMGRLVRPSVIPDIEAVGKDCIVLPAGILGTVLAGRKLPSPMLRAAPTSVEPWRSLVAENTPGHAPIAVPLFVAQGTADTVVDPAVTVRFVDALCRSGEQVAFREYEGASHFRIGKASARDTLAWIAGRFAGRPAPDTCR